MSLRTDFTGALNSKLAEARTTGYTFITGSNQAVISAAMVAAANSGEKTFTVTLTATYQPADLRQLGPLWQAFQTGCQEGLSSNDIMNNEVTVALNTSDQLTTSIDLDFTF